MVYSLVLKDSEFFRYLYDRNIHFIDNVRFEYDDELESMTIIFNSELDKNKFMMMYL